MYFVRDVCNKIVIRRLIPEFDFIHTKALLCFFKHGALNLPQLFLIMEETEKVTRKVILDLLELKLIKQKHENFLIDEFETLDTLVNLADAKKPKKDE
ncbi:MAG: hypothetical protein Q7K42_03095 [Candidatus Diapherotrites archaeon]|nr:hypothetical protein [Candidatus Diapherotrites archaeon]